MAEEARLGLELKVEALARRRASRAVPRLVPRDDARAASPAASDAAQERWCRMLLAGEKTVELRRYAIPEEFQRRPVLLLQTPDGSEGRSTLPPELLPEGFPCARVAGTVTFDGQVRYASYEQWAADAELHGVPPGTPYSWQPGVTREMFGWRVAAVEAAPRPLPVPAMRRVLSSWFREADGGGGGNGSGGAAAEATVAAATPPGARGE